MEFKHEYAENIDISFLLILVALSSRVESKGIGSILLQTNVLIMQYMLMLSVFTSCLVGPEITNMNQNHKVANLNYRKHFSSEKRRSRGDMRCWLPVLYSALNVQSLIDNLTACLLFC